MKTSTGVRGRDMGVEEGTGKEIGGRRNENAAMCGVTKLDKIRNERIRRTTKVGEITKKVQEMRLKWYGHVMRREEHYVGSRAMEMNVQGRRKRGRPKRRWLDKVKDDIKEKGLSADELYDRAIPHIHFPIAPALETFAICTCILVSLVFYCLTEFVYGCNIPE